METVTGLKFFSITTHNRAHPRRKWLATGFNKSGQSTVMAQSDKHTEQPPIYTQLTSYPVFPLFCHTCSSPIHLGLCLSSPLIIPFKHPIVSFTSSPNSVPPISNSPLYPSLIHLWARTSTRHFGGEFLSSILVGFTRGWRYMREVLVLTPICVDQKIVPLATSVSLWRHQHPFCQCLEIPPYVEVSLCAL